MLLFFAIFLFTNFTQFNHKVFTHESQSEHTSFLQYSHNINQTIIGNQIKRKKQETTIKIRNNINGSRKSDRTGGSYEYKFLSQ